MKDDKEQTKASYYFLSDSKASQVGDVDKSAVDYHIQSGRFDMSLPFSFVTIDAGASYTSIENRVDSRPYQGIIKPSHASVYLEKNKAAYLSLHHDWDRYSIKAGLRYEHIGLEKELFYNYIYGYAEKFVTLHSINDKVFSRDYWLPSFGFSVKPKDGHQIGLIWGTSTIRPNFYDLNPLWVCKSALEYVTGNPNLEPSRMSNVELSYQNHHGFYASVYHHHTSNVVGRRTRYIDPPQYPFTLTNVENGDRSNQTGLYLRFQRQMNQNILTTIEDEIYYHDYRSWSNDIPNLYG